MQQLALNGYSPRGLSKVGSAYDVLKTKIMKLKYNDAPDVGNAMMMGLAERLRLSRSSNTLVQCVVHTCL